MFLTKILEEQKTKYNGNVRVIKTFGSGVCIQSEGLTQSGGIVESIWKKTIKKVKKNKIEIKSCLILGLGGGTVAKIIRKYWPSIKITGVDIDPVMTNLGSKYLDLDKSHVDIKIGDALIFLNNNKSKKYDLVVVDLYNGDHYPEKFTSQNYIQLVKTALSVEGVAVFNRLYYGDKRDLLGDFELKLQKEFSNVDRFYPISNVMFLCS